jgi:hypothetical protein
LLGRDVVREAAIGVDACAFVHLDRLPLSPPTRALCLTCRGPRQLREAYRELIERHEHRAVDAQRAVGGRPSTSIRRIRSSNASKREHRQYRATRPPWSRGTGVCDDSMKLRLSSCGCGTTASPF